MACHTSVIDRTPSPPEPRRRGREAEARGSLESRVRPRAFRALRRGFTLAESLIASVVLAIAVVGVATTIAASHQQSSALEEDSVAVAAARQLMEEIAAKPLLATDATPGWGAGQKDRAFYDTINDYHGLDEASPVQTLEGVKMTIGSQPFVRRVKVTYPTTVFGTTVAAGEFALIEVTVTGPSNRDVTLKRLVAKTTRER